MREALAVRRQALIQTVYIINEKSISLFCSFRSKLTKMRSKNKIYVKFWFCLAACVKEAMKLQWR